MLSALASLAAPAHAVVPAIDWIPNSFIVPPTPSVSGTNVQWLQLTRRIVPQQRVPGRFMLGNSLYGLWESVPGFGWTPLMPQCLTALAASTVKPVTDVVTSLTGAPGCGVEAIAFDESADTRAPLTVYISTYNLNLSTGRIDPGGVFKAEIRNGNSNVVGSAGLIWRPLLTGLRGNAIAVSHPTGSAVTIIEGRIQPNNGNTDIGTDSNAWCAPGCQPSVYVSHDDGRSWASKSFTGSPCPAAVGTSSALVGGIENDVRNPSVFVAAANSGLWTSIDGGNTWSYSFYSCGNSPGFAITQRTPASAGRIYVGQNTDSIKTSQIYAAATGPAGPGAFSKLSLIDAGSGAPIASLPGWVQSIVLDTRDPSERTMFVSSWRDPGSPSQVGGVYKIVDQGNGTATVIDLKASFLDPYANCPLGLGRCLDRLPYPLIFNPAWRPSLFLAQHPLTPDLIYAGSVFGGVWTRSDGDPLPQLL